MAVVGRLKDGELLLGGEINERLPVVTDGLVAHYPFDGHEQSMAVGYFYKDDRELDTTDYVPGSYAAVDNPGVTKVVYLEAEIYFDTTPTRLETILLTKTSAPANSCYLSIGSSGKIHVYQYGRTGNEGYHTSNTVLQPKTWYKVAHISTPTESVIMIDGEVDRSVSGAMSGDMDVTYITVGAESSGRHFGGKIRNVRVDRVDPRAVDTTDTIMLDDYIALEPPTSNIVLNGDFANDFENWTNIDNNIIRLTTDPDMPIKTGKVVEAYAPVASGYGRARQTNLGLVTGKTYTISCWIKHSKQVDSWTRWFIYVKSVAGGNKFTVNSTQFDGEWHRCEVTFTPDADDYWISLESAPNTSGLSWMTGVQIEEKPYASTFTPTQTTGRGKFHLPISTIANRDKFSFALEFNIPYMYRTATGNEGLNGNWYHPIVEFARPDGSAYSFSFVAGPEPSSWNRKIRLLSPSGVGELAIQDNTWYHAVVTCDGGNTIVYIDGQEQIRAAAVADGYTDEVIMVGGGYRGATHSLIKNFSVYHKALSEAEAKKLAANKMSITKEGNLLTGVKEKPNHIPSDAIYFPLAEDGKDEGGMVEPSKELDTVYENGQMWIGSERVNILDNPGFETGSVSPWYYGYGTQQSGSHSIVNPQNGNGRHAIKAEITSSTARAGGDCSIKQKLSVPEGTGVTASVDILEITGDVDVSITLRCYNGTSYLMNHEFTTSVGRHTYTYTVPDGYTLDEIWIAVWPLAGGSTGYAIFDNVQVEETKYPTPYVDTPNIYTGESTTLGSSSTVQEGGWDKITVTTNGHGRRYKVPVEKLANYKRYATYATVHNPNNVAIDITIDWCDQGPKTFNILPGETKKISTIASRNDYSSTYRFVDFVIVDCTKGPYWVKDVQVRPTVEASDMKYALSFSDNQTFSFWHKRQYMDIYNTHEDSPTLFQIGNYFQNSSLIFWGYADNTYLRCYGRDDNATSWTWARTTKNNLTTAYWDDWHMYTITLEGSGGVVTGWKIYVDGVLADSLTGLNITSWNGSFYRFGKGSGTEANGYFRDYIYADRALSQEEIQAIYKTQMSQKDNTLQVAKGIKENQDLS